MGVSALKKLSTRVLRTELDRRKSRETKLLARRGKLTRELNEVDIELRELNPDHRGGIRTPRASANRGSNGSGKLTIAQALASGVVVGTEYTSKELIVIMNDNGFDSSNPGSTLGSFMSNAGKKYFEKRARGVFVPTEAVKTIKVEHGDNGNGAESAAVGAAAPKSKGKTRTGKARKRARFVPAKNGGKSLVDSIEEVMEPNTEYKIPDIANAVLKNGRKTNSKNFRSSVSATLSANPDKFRKAEGRGTWVLITQAAVA